MISENQVNNYAAAQLHVLRTTAGISQSMLGQEVGISGQQIQKYENALNRISAGKIMQFAEAFDVSVLVFFPDQGKRNSYEPLPPPAIRFVRLIKSISPKHYDQVYLALKAIAKLSIGEENAGN